MEDEGFKTEEQELGREWPDEPPEDGSVVGMLVGVLVGGTEYLVELGSTGVENVLTGVEYESWTEDGSTGVEVGCPGVLLVLVLTSYLASLRERSECPSGWIKRALKVANTRMLARYVLMPPADGNVQLQEFFASKGAAETHPSDATRAKMIKDLKTMAVLQIFL